MSQKVPIIIWQDAANRTTVKTVFSVDAHAYDPDEPKALDQVKRFLNWFAKRESFVEFPTVEDVQMDIISVPVRPIRELNARKMVSAETINVRTVAVYGNRPGGTILCSLPFFGIEFDCPAESKEKNLVHRLAKEHVQGAMRTASTNDICDHLLPESVRLDELFVKDVQFDFKFNATPDLPAVLSEVATPLSRRHSKKEFSRAWQRDEQVRYLANLIREENTNILIVGASGIGKTTMLVEAIRTIEREKESIPLWFDLETPSPPRFWLTNAARLIAGMKYLGQWEERCEAVIEELSEIPGVLCIEKAIDLLRYGGADANSSLGQFLVPFVVNRELRLIAEATESELQTIRRLLPGFDSLFQIVNVEPFSADAAVQVLDRLGQQFARNKRIEYEAGIVDLTYRLFKRFMPYEAFPGKCVGFWRSLLNEPRERENRDDRPKVNSDEVISDFISLTGLPEALIRDEVPMIHEDLNAQFRSQVIGQDHACELVTSVITNFKAGLNDPSRPLGVMLFCGPTGVGKTELVKQLSKNLFGSGKAKDRLVRLDMSEYAVPGSAERLLIQNDGKPSALVRKMREQPFCVLLFDEIEKASHEVFDALMTVFDEGRLTDRLGRETVFQSAVIVMTSNLGTRTSSPIGFESSDSDNYLKAVKQFFRPEFFNRFDFVVPFRKLDKDDVEKIIEKELKQLRKREGLEKRHIKLTWDKDVPVFIAEIGYDIRYGARPLQRTIEQYIVKPISHQLAQNPSAKSSRIHLRVEEGEIKID